MLSAIETFGGVLYIGICIYLGKYKESAASQLMHQLVFINLLHLYNRHPLGIDKYHTKGGRLYVVLQ